MRPNSSISRSLKISIALVLLAATTTFAVHPQAWSHQTENDYKAGHFDNTIVNSYGELTLGRQVQPIPVPPTVDFVNSFVQTKDGTVYFGTSPAGKVFKIVDAKAEPFYTPPQSHDSILAVGVDATGQLIAAESGEDSAHLVRLTEEAGKVTAKTIFQDEAVGAIWAIKTGPDGATYLGTGPEGKVYRLDQAGKATVVLETGAKNVISLAFDAKGNLIAGTDGNGLVIRVDKATGKPFVLLDAGHVDVTSLITDESGNIFVATASSDLAGGPDLDEEPGTRSRPGKVEPETPDTGDELPPDIAPKPKPAEPKATTKPAPRKASSIGPTGLIELPPFGVNAEMAPPMPADIKALVEKLKPADSDAKKKPPTTNKKKEGLPAAKGKKPLSKIHRRAPEEEPEEGSAIYQIAPDGTVRTLLRESSMNLALLLNRGELLIGTGPDGKLFSYKPDTEATALIARVGHENIMSLFAARDGAIYLGVSNAGGVYTLGNSIASKGTYTSDVLDASHTATWGRARLLANVPEGTRATIATRTGNVKDIKKSEKFWSDWSEEIPAGEATGGKAIESPAARFLQYRITLTGDGKGSSPTVQQARVAFQVENLPPRLKNVKADVSDTGPDEDQPRSKTPEEGPAREVFISWEASDPNRDELAYRVLYREVGSGTWVQIAKDLTDTSYTWNTRAIPDGRYQIKVIASDAPDNTPAAAKSVAQVTSPVTIDNTPPVLSDLAATVDNAVARITGTAKDKLSPVVDVRYQIDGLADWHPAIASDKIFDSPSESFMITTRALSPGNHRITVRTTDSHANSSYQAVTVTVK